MMHIIMVVTRDETPVAAGRYILNSWGARIPGHGSIKIENLFVTFLTTMVVRVCVYLNIYTRIYSH